MAVVVKLLIQILVSNQTNDKPKYLVVPNFLIN